MASATSVPVGKVHADREAGAPTGAALPAFASVVLALIWGVYTVSVLVEFARVGVFG